LGNFVDERYEMELERAMQQWIIMIAGNVRIEAAQPRFHVMQQLQREIGVKALIMVERFISQSPEAQDCTK